MAFFKNKTQEVNTKTNVVPENIEPKKPTPTLEEIYDSLEWAEMTGYKAVDINSHSFYGDIIFEVGKTYSLKDNERAIPYHTGFHFCPTLEDALQIFKPIFGRKYYKVKALVPIKTIIPKNDTESSYTVILGCYALADELSKCDETREWHSIPGKNWQEEKYVSKEMTILEEVPFEQYANKALNAFIETEEEYKTITVTSQYKTFIKTKWIEQAKLVFSEGFVIYVWNKLEERANQNKRKYVSGIAENVEDLLENYSPAMEALNAIKDEKISQDVKVLCFLQFTGIM